MPPTSRSVCLSALLVLVACGETAPLDAVPDASTGFHVDEPTSLVTGLDKPNGIAVDEEAVYWVDGDEGAMSIRRHDLATGEDTLLGTTTFTAQITVSGDHVYWADATANTVHRVPRRGGAPEQLLSDPDSVNDVAIDGTRMYWVDDVAVWSARTDGTDRDQIAEVTVAATDVFVDEEQVVWVSPDGVKAVAKTGGEVIRIADEAGNAIRGGGHVYWTSRTEWHLTEADSAGANPAAIQEGVTPGRVAFADGELYWALLGQEPDAFGGPGGVWKRGDGGAAVEVVSVSRGAVGIAVRDDLIFYTEMAIGSPGEGAIWVAPR